MYKLSESSSKILKHCHPALIAVVTTAIRTSPLDFKVISGYRTKEEQNALYERGLSQKNGIDKLSKHQGVAGQAPSLAVDLAPYPIDWNDLPRFYVLAGAVLTTAAALGTELRWGGNWDRDNDLKDQSFMDLGHFELV